MGYSRRRRSWIIAVVTAVLTVVGAVSAQSIPIPSVPPPLLSPTFVGAPATANPIASPAVPQNPFMAPNGTNNMHNDAYASNTYTGPGPLGRKPIVTSNLYGVEECATIAFDSAGRIVGLCGSLQGSVLRLINPTTMAVIGSHTLPGRNLASGANP